MSLATSDRRRVVVGAIGAGAITGALLCASAATAAADPPRPANCTAGDVAGVGALFEHGDDDDFDLDGLRGGLSGGTGCRCEQEKRCEEAHS